jgi:2'-5' RNA ligase
MPYAVELFLDERADRRIRQIWATLDDHGITSLGSIPGAAYRPHVSLSVFENGDPEEVAEALRPVLEHSVGLPLPLEPLGFFLTKEAPAFLGVVPSARLLALHQAVHRTIEPLVETVWPHYHPDALVPHCTLAMGVTNKAKLTQIMEATTTPIQAHATTAHLVQIPGAQSTTPLTP